MARTSGISDLPVSNNPLLDANRLVDFQPQHTLLLLFHCKNHIPSALTKNHDCDDINICFFSTAAGRWRKKAVYFLVGVYGLRLAGRVVARVKANALSGG